MLFEEFQDGNRGYQNSKILAILNLCVVLMPPIKFRLNSGLEFRRICHLQYFKMVSVAASLDIGTERF